MADARKGKLSAAPGGGALAKLSAAPGGGALAKLSAAPGGGALAVAVLGAAGTIAPAIVRDLAQSEEVASMALLDLDADKAGAVAREHGAGKASAAAVDARDVDALARAIQDAGAGVLVN